jgi:two-component system, NarL family, response regulator LiaR
MSDVSVDRDQNTATEKITVVTADDHLVVRQGLRAFLETQPDFEIVGEASSGEEAVMLCQDYAPDVVLMDLVMPEIGGIEATRQIKQVSPRTQIIIITSFHEDGQILPAIQAGALSYLLKDVTPSELIAAVRKAWRGEVVLHPRVAARLMQVLQRDDASDGDHRLTALSKRETDVLRLVAEGISNHEIAERLFISEKTVKSHVSNVLSKLHLSDRTQAAVYAWRMGLVSTQNHKGA